VTMSSTSRSRPLAMRKGNTAKTGVQKSLQLFSGA
jgi:hypothetical protein